MPSQMLTVELSQEKLPTFATDFHPWGPTLKIYLQPGAKLDAKLTGALKKAGAEVYDVVKDKVVRRNLN